MTKEQLKLGVARELSHKIIDKRAVLEWIHRYESNELLNYKYYTPPENIGDMPLIQRVCEIFNVEEPDLYTRKRGDELNWARYLIYHIDSNMNRTQKDMASAFGRDRVTARIGMERLRNLYEARDKKLMYYVGKDLQFFEFIMNGGYVDKR